MEEEEKTAMTENHSRVTAMRRVPEASQEIWEERIDQALSIPKTAEEPKARKRRREAVEISEEIKMTREPQTEDPGATPEEMMQEAQEKEAREAREERMVQDPVKVATTTPIQRVMTRWER